MRDDSKTLADLVESVDKQTTYNQSILTMISGFVRQLSAAVDRDSSKSSYDEIRAVIADLDTRSTDFSAACEMNTDVHKKQHAQVPHKVVTPHA